MKAKTIMLIIVSALFVSNSLRAEEKDKNV
jgi:hypothetical protein